MEKIFQIYLSYSKSLYIVFWYEMAQAAMLDKIIYSWKEINQMRETFWELR